MNRLHCALAAIGVLAASSPAVADVTSTAAIANLQFFVYDLDPNDGIDAGFEFGNFQTDGGFPLYPGPTAAYGSATHAGGTDDFINLGTSSYFEPMGDSATGSGSSLVLFTGSDSFYARGDATQAGGAYTGFASSGLYAGPLNWQFDLRLTPNTALYVGAYAQVTTSIRDTCVSGIGCEHADASVKLYITHPGPGGLEDPVFSASSFSSSLTGSAGGSGERVTQTKTDLLLNSFFNLSADYGLASFFIEAKVGGSAAIAVAPEVPEPGTVAMALAGLGLLAARLRRR